MSFKKLIIFTLLIIFHNQLFPQKHYMIVWDVTSSMIGVTNIKAAPNYGYDKEKDIFEAVKTNIINHINSFDENIGDIYIIPFRERVLSVLKYELTDQGKQIAKEFVRKQSLRKEDGSPDPTFFSGTNICGAFVEAMKYVKIDNETIIYLYTDGEQNIPYISEGTDCLRGVVGSYCNKYNGSNVFTFMISLNNSLNRVNLDLNKICNNFEQISIDNPGSIANIRFIKVKPTLTPLYYNLVQKRNIAKQVFQIDGGALPGDFTFDAVFTCDNSSNVFKLKDFNKLKITEGGTSFQINSSLKSFPANATHGRIALLNPRTNSKSIIRFQPDTFDVEISSQEPPRVKIMGFTNEDK